jgi:hypothetical protein
MIEKPAKGVRGFLLYSPFTKDYFFRVYGEKDPNGHRKFKDYKLCAEDIEITLNTNYISLYDDEEDEENNKLSYSSKVLGNDKGPRQSFDRH